MIKFIMGKAGTGKTYSTIMSLVDVKKINVLCMSFTHSALKNMKNYIPEDKLKKFKFNTLHKFFRIPIPFAPVAHNISLDSYTHIIIDEFSLIPLDIFNFIFECIASANVNIPVIFIGDLLQLPPIADLQVKQFDYQFFKKHNDIWNKIDKDLDVAYYLSNTIYVKEEYQKADKMIFKKNYRSCVNVLNILNDVLNNKKIVLSDISCLTENTEFTVIASEYKLLTQALLLSRRNGEYPTKIGNVKNKKCILNETLNEDFINGEEVDIINILKNNEVEIQNKEGMVKNVQSVKLLPYNFITIHKAQGRGYDNVILIIDDMFEITMLYTAITRAKKTIKFIMLNKKHQDFNEIIDKFNKLEKVIY